MGTLDEFAAILRPNEPLSRYTALQTGGSAEYLAEPQSVEQLSGLVACCYDAAIPVRLLGGGTNLLVSDEGVAGVVIRLAAAPFCEVRIDGSLVHAGGGAQLSDLVSDTVGQGLSGLETLVGIPGTVGGALHGNTGGKTGDIGQWTQRATVMTKTGDLAQRDRDDLVFAYRQSSLDELVILSAEFELPAGDPQELARRMHRHWIVTRANQPPGHQPCCYAFKDPPGLTAADLIDQVGLKGYRVGGAELSERHPNFIASEPGAASGDVLQLLQVVCAEVRDRLGIELEPAVQIW